MHKEIADIQLMMANDSVKKFTVEALHFSMSCLGFSNDMITDLINCLEYGAVLEFQKRYSNELHMIQTMKFYRKLVPIYYEKHILPHIPNSKKLLDVGCGTGVLASIIERSKKCEEIRGIDINSYPEWNDYSTNTVSFKIIHSGEFKDYLTNYKPDVICLTWVLHHMAFKDQVRYLKHIYDSLESIKLVILEDSYSEKEIPAEGTDFHGKFISMGKKERNHIISIHDWIANRILAQRESIPIPFTYRTLEEWVELLSGIGYTVSYKKYIGFPVRDVMNPQAVIIAEKF
jgi:hypothetical protein